MQREAQRAGQFYVNNRWLGGMLTNFRTVRKSIERFKEQLGTVGDEEQVKELSKKDLSRLNRSITKYKKSLDGIQEMTRLPDALFVIDVGCEHIAVSEARRLGIPIVGVVDTNCEPGRHRLRDARQRRRDPRDRALLQGAWPTPASRARSCSRRACSRRSPPPPAPRARARARSGAWSRSGSPPRAAAAASRAARTRRWDAAGRGGPASRPSRRSPPRRRSPRAAPAAPAEAAPSDAPAES